MNLPDLVEITPGRGWKVAPLFAWYDLWIGAFWDRTSRKLYILPVPCVGIVITFPIKPVMGMSQQEIDRLLGFDDEPRRFIKPRSASSWIN